MAASVRLQGGITNCSTGLKAWGKLPVGAVIRLTVPSRINYLETVSPEMQKPAEVAGLTSGEAGETLGLVNLRIPEISPSVKRKRCFR